MAAVVPELLRPARHDETQGRREENTEMPDLFAAVSGRPPDFKVKELGKTEESLKNLRMELGDGVILPGDLTLATLAPVLIK